MARRVNAWECGYCGRLYKREKATIRHEKACLRNPDAKNCLYCAHYRKDPIIFSLEEEEASDHFAYCAKNHGKCSRAVSANCKDFERSKPSDYEGDSNMLKVWSEAQEP